jgi:lipoprotein NlpI
MIQMPAASSDRVHLSVADHPLFTVLLLSFALLGTACTRENADAKNCAQQANADVALEVCSRAIASGQLSPPKLATTLYNRGLAYERRGEFDRAIQDFDRVIELRPDTSKAFYNRAIAYHKKGEFDRAIQDFDRVVQLTPDYAPAFRNRGNAYRGALAFDQAIQNYNEAIRLSPEYAVAFSNRGVAYLNKGMYDRAIQDFDQAIRLKPDDAAAYRGRGSAYYDTGEFKKAAADFAKAAELDRGDPYAAIQLFLADSRVGVNATPRLRDGASSLDLEKWPGHVISMYLGQASADQVLDAAKRTNPKAERELLCEAHYYIGQGLVIRGQRDRAIGMFQAAVAPGPASAVEYSGARAELKRLGR